MGFDQLPPEVVLCLAEVMPNCSLSALIRTQRSLAYLLTPILYRDIIKEARYIKLEQYPREKCVPYWADCIGRWKSQIILNYFQGLPRDVLKPASRDSTTWFHLAARDGNIELAKISESKRLTVKYHFIRKPSPLCLALQRKQESMAAWLLESESYAHTSASVEEELLKLAMDCSHNMLQLVIDNLENKNFRHSEDDDFVDLDLYTDELNRDYGREYDGYDATAAEQMISEAVCWAVYREDEQALLLLLDHGADPLWYIDVGRESTFGYANRDVTKLILDRYAGTPIFKELVEEVLRDSVEENWDWPRLKQFLQLVLETGCGINSIPCSGGYPTVLFLFTAALHVEAVVYLLEKGADVYQRTSCGLSILHLALINRPDHPSACDKICKRLIRVIGSVSEESGREFDFTLPSGEPWKGGNILHLAIEMKANWVIYTLLKSGFDTEVENDEGKTALDLAEEVDEYIARMIAEPESAGSYPTLQQLWYGSDHIDEEDEEEEDEEEEDEEEEDEEEEDEEEEDDEDDTA